MKSGGRTTDIGVGRHILCNEKPGTRAASVCAKKLTSTVKAAKKGMTAKQQKLWRKYVYTPALLQVGAHCRGIASKIYSLCPDWTPCDEKALTRKTRKQVYAGCVEGILSGKQKFPGLFRTKFQWADYLINGAKIFKKILQIDIKIEGTNPNK